MSTNSSRRENHSVLDAALRYTSAGWHVFPVYRGSKIPATENGFLDASSDPGQIYAWFAGSRDNVAIRTGAPFGPDVVDVDVHEGASGFAALNQARRAGLLGQPSAIVRTPSGGAHLYYKGSLQSSGPVREQLLELKSQGGAVTAPPSIGRNGRRYELVGHRASNAEVDWPAVKRLLEPERPKRACQADQPTDLDRLVRFVSEQEHGNRNRGLFWASCRVAEAGLLDTDATERLVEAAVRSGLRGGEREARKAIASAAKTAGRPGPTRQPEREAG